MRWQPLPRAASSSDQGDVEVPVSVVPFSVVPVSTTSVTVSIRVVVSWTVSVTVWITVVAGSVNIPPGSLIECRLGLTAPSEGLAKYVLSRIRSRKSPSTVCVSIPSCFVFQRMTR